MALSTRLEALIRSTGLRPGDKLPAERVLAARLGVSRASLREALGGLAQGGRLHTRQGSGHYLQTPPLAAAMAPLAPLMRQNPSYWQDVMEIRRALEAEAAHHAAMRATSGDKARLAAHCAALASAHEAGEPLEDARADAALHLLIAEASHNLVLLQMMRGLFELLQASISHSLEKLYTRPQTFRTLARQHHALTEAIIAGQPDQARRAALLHLDFVAATLRRIEDDEARRLRLSSFPTQQESETP
ncbi:FCD domain-containing protein [Acidocella sp.]|uniref:FCD domain-containing protein n=1 Tax=Acidocella sp. TaxID=50710 RepID=UPI003CFE3152